MGLGDLTLRNQYRSDRNDLLRDFYIPCLRQAIAYDRAVGFFSSTSLALVAQGLTSFIQSDGQMRLVASPRLSEEDIVAIEQGLKQRDQVIAESLSRELEPAFEQVVRDRLACLAWLLSKGFLEIKIAVQRNPISRGLYHEKLGVFTDSEGNQVVFTGSANESASAYQDNFECIDVFRSWQLGDDQRISEKLEDFQRLWDNQTANLEVMAFPEASRRKLLTYCPDQAPNREPGVSTTDGDYNLSSAQVEQKDRDVPRLPFGLKIRPYQQQAIDNWFANKGRGTLKMATGSGKTITSLAIATRLYEEIQLQALIIVCPYRHLVSQWARECRKFGITDPILAFESVSQWQGHLSNQLYNVRAGSQAFLTVITTNATLMTSGFQSQLPYFPKKTMLVGDEAHNLGAKRLESSLPRRSVGLRLALSATPERYFDDEGTEATN